MWSAQRRSDTRGECCAEQCYLWSAINKYGPEQFVIEQIDVADSLEELNRKEVWHILRLGTLVPGGYNLTAGGKGGLTGFKHSVATREKMRQTQMLRSDENKKKIGEKISKALMGRTFSKEAREKMSIAAQGKIFLEETRNKISLVQKGKFVSQETRLRMGRASRGRIASLETRQKISESWLKRPRIKACKRGHMYVDGSYYSPKQGGRLCKMCVKIRSTKAATA